MTAQSARSHGFGGPTPESHRHAVLVLDGAGRHARSGGLKVPPNITLLTLPPYSPELNPVELVRLGLQGHLLSNRVFAGQKELDQTACDAWNSIDAPRFKSLCSTPWITREIQT